MQLEFLVIVENFETRRHTGFEWKALQQALGKSVNGLHLQAARRLYRAGEQRAGALDLGRFLFDAGQVMQNFRKPIRGHSDPLGQLAKHALRHLGGGGFGVGQAQDALRPGASQQQAQHAHGENVSLAGTSVRANPS